MATSIRIAQVVEAVGGGCRKHVLDLATGLDPARFHQTVIFSSNRDPEFGARLVEATGGTVEAIPWDVQRGLRLRSDAAGCRFLRRLFLERDFDLVHCHSSKAGMLGRLAARRLRAVKVYTPHCFPFQMDTDPRRRAAYLWLERLGGWYTDCLVTVAPYEATLARLMRIVRAERIVTIENGVDPAAYDVAVDVPRKKAELGLAATDRVVLAVGALRPQKGYRHLIEAAPGLIRQEPRARVLIAGEGRLRPALTELIQRLGVGEHVRLLGDRADVPELLKAADCLAMASLWEGGPYTVLEAMAAGTPVVCTRVPGLTDWVHEGRTGRLAEPRDAQSLADTIARALAETDHSRRMAAEAKEMVLRRNTKARWLAEMVALYEKLAGSQA